jgi:hypothetical protein
MRTTKPDVIDFTWITLNDAAKRLTVEREHVLALGEAGELEIADLRLPGRSRGVYRVDPNSVTAFLARRTTRPNAVKRLYQERAAPACTRPG